MHVLVPGKLIAFKGVCACVCVHVPAMSGAMFEEMRGLDVEKCVGCVVYLLLLCARVLVPLLGFR
jgi:hypothetical protein